MTRHLHARVTPHVADGCRRRRRVIAAGRPAVRSRTDRSHPGTYRRFSDTDNRPGHDMSHRDLRSRQHGEITTRPQTS